MFLTILTINSVVREPQPLEGVRITVQDSVWIKRDTFATYNLFPVLPEGMTYNEFKYLQIKIDYWDRMWSMILPGYLHFITYDRTGGFISASVRILGLALMGYAMYIGAPGAVEGLDPNALKLNAGIFGVGMFLNFAGWVYDVVHGEYRLRDMQMRILYRYRSTYPYQFIPPTEDVSGVE
ncbi:MAG: hypothetical protein GXO39_03235 [Thermotogae bacterium]|nr:hypothetical protein [Thermotogota bacterium]